LRNVALRAEVGTAGTKDDDVDNAVAETDEEKEEMTERDGAKRGVVGAIAL